MEIQHSLYLSVSFYRDTTLSVFLSIYLWRYNTLCIRQYKSRYNTLCILQYLSRYNTLCNLYSSVSINRDTTLSVFVSIYQDTTPSVICIPQYLLIEIQHSLYSLVSIEIRHPLYSLVSIYWDTTCSWTQCPTNNTSVCINPDTTLYVFFSMYRTDTIRSRTPYLTDLYLN